MSIPFFLTVDAEGDNLWKRPEKILSSNTERLYRFQLLCEKYNIKPIYLTNYEAAINLNYQKFIKKHKQNLEIGLHLHAWNSPPYYNLTGNDYKYHPYLHEYPENIIAEKIKYMVNLLKKTFNSNIISHRGGRYSISENIINLLVDNGIKIDCSVVPGVDWSLDKGHPEKSGGVNFKNFSPNIHRLYDKILEVPVSTYRVNKYFDLLPRTSILSRSICKITNYRHLTLRSKVSNLNELKKVVNWNLEHNVSHLEYIIHSSELVLGTSPLIKSIEEENSFYANLEDFFSFLESKDINPMTFQEYLEFNK